MSTAIHQLSTEGPAQAETRKTDPESQYLLVVESMSLQMFHLHLLCGIMLDVTEDARRYEGHTLSSLEESTDCYKK